MKYKVLAECSGADCTGVHMTASGGNVPAACDLLLQMAKNKEGHRTKDKEKGCRTMEFDPCDCKYQMDSADNGLWLCYNMRSGLCLNYILLQEDGDGS